MLYCSRTSRFSLQLCKQRQPQRYHSLNPLNYQRNHILSHLSVQQISSWISNPVDIQSCRYLILSISNPVDTSCCQPYCLPARGYQMSVCCYYSMQDPPPPLKGNKNYQFLATELFSYTPSSLYGIHFSLQHASFCSNTMSLY